MAEIAALAVSIVGLASLFTTCMQGFECIQLGKTFGEDYTKCLLRADIARLRLVRWAETVGLTSPESRQNYQRSLTSQEYATAAGLLEQISYAFEEMQKASKMYEKTARAKAHDTQSLAPAEADAELDFTSRALHSSLRAQILKRQRVVGLGRKAKWALYEKKRFDRTLEDIGNYVTELIELFPAMTEQHRSLCREDVEAIGNDQELQALGSVVEEDNLLQEALEQTMTARGHVFMDFTAHGASKMHAGDINHGVTPGYHNASKVTSYDTAHLHVGNVNFGPGRQAPQRFDINHRSD